MSTGNFRCNNLKGPCLHGGLERIKGEYLRHMQIIEHAESLAPLHACSLVPTMGALHAGHASLIQRAARDGRAVVVSLFVNPTQFAAGEDFSKYPRTLEADRALCQTAGAAAENEMRRVLAQHKLEVEYAVIRAPDTLLTIEKFEPKLKSGARALIAARLESVRLIDNASCGGA